MKEHERSILARESAEGIYNSLRKMGAACYRTRSCYRILWIPWGKYQATDLNEPRAIAHALVMSGGMPSDIAMRMFVVDEFITICRNSAISIRNAPEKAKAKAREMRLI